MAISSGNIPRQIFREYDIRGVADRDLTDDLAHAIGQCFGRQVPLGADRTVAVGRDCRLSSPRLFSALTTGLTEVGCSVKAIGIGPTPLLYFAAHYLKSAAAIMITGSHNPGDENGFKMMLGTSSFYGPQIQDLLAAVETQDSTFSGRLGTVQVAEVEDAYVDAMKERFNFSHAKDLKFVLDAGNGSGGPLGLKVMRALGLSPDPLFCDMDGTFPNHHPDPTVEHNLEALVKRVKETGARVGLAYDGDADRLGAVDELGNVIWGDKLMVLFSRQVLAKNPGAAIIGEVKCSQTLYDDIAAHGGRPIMWKTGHSLIKTKMKEEHALLAGEMSGHLFFADRYFGYDDGIYASLRLLEILANDPRPLSAHLADVPQTFTTPEMRTDCPDAIKFAVVKAVTERFQAEGRKVNTTDGARVDFSDPEKPGELAWGLVRASNTGPILVLRFEASTAARRDQLVREVQAVVDEEKAKAQAKLGR
jgi:phosphomannomutase/phosphoglucomutase